ncbi:MAG: GNAT family N-acetyltransferase, partial [Candidatus Kariarchaeaceae archaeon]
MPVGDVSFRFATKDDNEVIYDFAMRAISESILPRFAEDAGEDLYQRISSGDPRNVAIAEVENEGIVAYIEIDPDRSSRDKVVYIRGIFVLEAFRRRRIGRRLLQMMREEKCKDDYELYVDAYTTEGVQFWKSLGFDIDRYV